jgi:hypothetical protein
MNYYFVALLLACTAYAMVAGGGPERVGAGIYALSCVLSVIAYQAPPIRFQSVEIGVFLVDVAVFVAFIPLALNANRYWPLWVSALLGIGVLGHLAMLVHPRVIPWAYAAVLSMWSYPILLLIVIGTAAHRRRLKRNGADPSWTRSSAPAGPPPPAPGPTR